MPAGSRAEENIMEMRFGSGTVVKLEYHEEEWPDGYVVPYQVLLDNGRLIYVPSDDDDTITDSHRVTELITRCTIIGSEFHYLRP